MDVMVDYIRHKCTVLTGERDPVMLLAECNQIVSNLYIIFDGDSEFVTLTLLKTDLLAGSSAVALMYPVFEQILTTNQFRLSTSGPLGLMEYVRLLLCYKKWKAMVPARRDKDTIAALAMKILPLRCPEATTRQDLPFVRMLPRVSAMAKEQNNETRFLLAKDLMDIEQLCAIYFREYENRFSHLVAEKLSTVEIKSNYINIDALVEFIQRKCNLLRSINRDLESPAKATASSRQQQQQQLQHESNAIISSLRLIFRRDERFITLTLLRVETAPEWQSILGPVYDRFLAHLDPATVSANNLESYGRLLLCFIKWKLLYPEQTEEPEATAATRHRERIDTIACATLPYDIPRAVKRKELALKALFPRVATAVGRRKGKSAKVTVTRALLNSKHVRDNIRTICSQFLAICRGGKTNDSEPLSVATTVQHAHDEDEVEIIKSECNSVIILDSEDEDDNDNDSNKPVSSAAGFARLDEIEHSNAAANITLIRAAAPDIDTKHPVPSGKMLETDQSFTMETIFNTPPPTPTTDDTSENYDNGFILQQTDCQTGATFCATGGSVCKAKKQKNVLPLGVNFRISRNVRLQNSRVKRDFLTAFRKLTSKNCFQVRLTSELADYCLLKKMYDSVVFVDILDIKDTNVSPGIALKSYEEDENMLVNKSFDYPSSNRFEEPSLPNHFQMRSLVDNTLTKDDQLLTLIAAIDDLPPASVDFAVFSEESDRFSIEILANNQEPPSSVMDENALWHSDACSMFAGLDFNQWLDPEISNVPSMII
ncbi:uncharacterized protein LOC129721214 isoform X2 [Wyeomyia smithii]|nr:uncharacterized protein LOC129721214 isoform X2 [Wyeomyia smithii]